jgi:hypothetical protein
VPPRTTEPMKSKNHDSSRKPAAKKSKAPPVVPDKAKKTKPRRSVAKSKPEGAPKQRATKKKALKIPPLLLEGDVTTAQPISGPGQRYALGPIPPPEHFASTEGELPESYGTMQLFITARDPHWLYAHWDLSREQLKKFNGLSVDHHLVLRIYRDAIVGEPLTQIHLHPESRNWFVPVAHAGAKYAAELGYYDLRSQWKSVSSSGATFTPPDTLAEDTTARFATIPSDVPFEQLLALVKTAIREHVPLVEALQQLRAEGYTQLPAAAQIAGEWTPAQEQALAAVISMDQVRRIWIGSLEITELIRRQLQQEISSLAVSQFGLPSSPMGAFGSISSAFGGMPQKGFWFNINAELIIYGATEPDAAVTIGGKKIKLRPDGTFSFRFALPDGNYNLPAVATSADGDDSRNADLKFSRITKYGGEVGAHPQDPKLKPPVVEAVA